MFLHKEPQSCRNCELLLVGDSWTNVIAHKARQAWGPATGWNCQKSFKSESCSVDLKWMLCLGKSKKPIHHHFTDENVLSARLEGSLVRLKENLPFIFVCVGGCCLEKGVQRFKKKKTQKTLRTNVDSCVWELNVTDSSGLPRDGTHYSLHGVVVVILSLSRVLRMLSWNGSLAAFPDQTGNKGRFVFKRKVFLIRSEIMVMKEEASN